LKRNPKHLKARQNLEFILRQSKNDQSDSNEKSEDMESNESSQDNQQNEQADQNKSSQTKENNKETQTDTTESKKNEPEELTEQQIQYLVDNAEKQAREKRQQKIDNLFEDGEW